MGQEEKLQADCFQWFWNEYPAHRRMLYHNNNNSVNRIAGNKAKAVGVVAGVSDFTLIAYGNVVFIEMKTLTGGQRPEQIDFQEKVMERGHIYVIVRTLEEFKKLICTIIGK